MNTSLDSFSAAASSMEDTSNPTITTNKNRNKEDEVDAEVWATFNNSFRQVQSVLDRNRVLIQQVNDNHQSRIPDNMVKNVALIQELNGNISKVVGLYSDLNSNFSFAYQQRNHNGNETNGVSVSVEGRIYAVSVVVYVLQAVGSLLLNFRVTVIARRVILQLVVCFCVFMIGLQDKVLLPAILKQNQVLLGGKEKSVDTKAASCAVFEHPAAAY
ncbi:unnamed protein product [Dovyalis caffra]|uniref:Protein EARLY FLOWERING 4 domain-containing protein n=1 Tax=Dovyalis caffra TaxID=77055 RepID=A0AAV1QW30_9ROSI|nr:unnamed protein product [Dovyalis caffra]